MKQIILTNFKGYTVPTSISFSDITINVGMNSVGKSTAVQALLIVRQTFDELSKYSGTQKTDFRIFLNGPYDLQLGDYDQLTSTGAGEISIVVDDTSLIYRKSEDEFSLSFLWENGIASLPDIVLFSPSFYYINAERIGPRNYQDIGNEKEKLCGYHGEYTFEVINRFRDQAIPEERQYNDSKTGTVITFLKQLEYWMDYIVPGLECNRTGYLRNRETAGQAGETVENQRRGAGNG